MKKIGRESHDDALAMSHMLRNNGVPSNDERLHVCSEIASSYANSEPVSNGIYARFKQLRREMLGY